MATFTETERGKPVGPQTLGQEFGRGVQSGTVQMKASLFGLADIAGSVLGSQGLRDYALAGLADAQEDAERLAPTIGQFSDIDGSGEFFTWAAGAIGQQVPVLATMIGSGGLGGAVAQASLKTALRFGLRAGARRSLIGQFGRVSARELDRAVLKQLDDPATQRLLRQSFSRGAGAGAAGSSFGIQAGDLQNQLTEAGIDAPLTAITGGAVAAALDAAPVVFLMGRLFPGVDRALSKAFIADIAKTTGLQGALEGGTEAAQELVTLASRAYHDPSIDITSPANRLQVLNAAAAGALVGALTGGAGETVSAAPRASRGAARRAQLGASRLTEYAKTRVELARSTAQVAAGEQDALVPGVQELRQAASSFLSEQVAPALSGAGERLRAGVDATKVAIGSVDLGVDLAGIASSLDEKIRIRVAPVLNSVLAAMHQQIDAIRGQVAQLPLAERAAALQAGLEKIKQGVSGFIEQRLKPLVKGAEDDLASEVRTKNYDDEDLDIESPDPDEMRDPQDLTRVTLGQAQKRTRTRGGVTVSSTVRTRDDDAVAFTSRGAADQAVREVRESFPNLPEDAIDVEQRGDGFVVAIRDIGAAEEVFEQLRFADGLTDAREASRANPDQSRRIEVKRPGAAGFTRLDLPTLVLAGQDMVERGGTKLPENRSKAALRGLDAILGRLIDQGYEFKGGINALRGKMLFEGMPVGEARRRSQFAPEQDPEAREAQLQIEAGAVEPPAADTPVFDAGGRVDPDRGLGRQENVTETEAAANEATKRAPRVGRRAMENWYDAREGVRVGIGAVPEKTQNEIADLVRELLGIAGLRNRVFVVDRAGAQTLVEHGHPLSSALVDWQTTKSLGRIAMLGDDAVIYLSDDVLIDKKGGSVDAAKAKTFVVLAHEIGHLVENVYYKRLSPELKEQLYNGFLKWVKENPDRKHSLSFDEFMANQFTSWAIRDRAPSDAVETFFDTVVQALRKIYDYIRSRYTLDDTFAEFMRGIHDQARGANTLNPFAVHFQSQGIVGRVYFKPTEASADVVNLDDYRPLTRIEEAEAAVAEAAAGRKEIINKRAAIRGRHAGLAEENDFTAQRMERELAPLDRELEANDQELAAARAELEAAKAEIVDEGFDIELEPMKAGLRAKVNKLLNEYPGMKQAGVRTLEMMQHLHDQLTSSVNGVLRRMQLPAANELADLFNRTPGAATTSPTYFNALQLQRAVFSRQFNLALKQMSQADKAVAVKDLIAGKRVEAISGVFERLYDYMIAAGLPVKRISDYWPRIWDVEAAAKNAPAISAKLQELGLTQQQADLVINHMTGTGSEVDQKNFEDPLTELPYQAFLQERAAVLDDPYFQQFQSRDLDRTIERYLQAVIKRSEFNRYLGSDARTTDPDGEWDPRGKLNQLLARAKAQGATPEQLKQMVHAVDVMLGRYGRDFPASVRHSFSWLMTYQNVRLLLFSTLASLPDVVGPAIRTGEFRSAFKSLRDNFREIVSKESDLSEMARAFGVVSDEFNKSVLTEHFETHWMPERARRINEAWFRAVGLERWTGFVRTAALAVGRDAIKRWAGENNTNMLSELGLTPEVVRSWIVRGEPVFGSAGYDSSNAGDQKIAEALITMVNESIMRPNPSQRPAWMSHPGWMLVGHLKSFLYAMSDTVLRRMYYNMQQAGTPYQKAMIVAGPAFAMLALTALGLELREAIQYTLFGKTPRTDKMNGLDYVSELTLRSGLLGVSQLAVDFSEADQRGQLGVVAISGPTLSHLNELLSDPLSQSLPRSLPIAASLPAVREAIRDVTPL